MQRKTTAHRRDEDPNRKYCARALGGPHHGRIVMFHSSRMIVPGYGADRQPFYYSYAVPLDGEDHDHFWVPRDVMHGRWSPPGMERAGSLVEYVACHGKRALAIPRGHKAERKPHPDWPRLDADFVPLVIERKPERTPYDMHLYLRDAR